MSSHRSKIRLTRSGKILFFLGIFLLFAAQNTGNNLLYLMSSCFFACLVWSGVTGWRNLSGLKIELLLPDYYFAGQQDAIRCRIEDRVGRPRFFIGFAEDFAEFLPANSFLLLKSDLQASRRGSHKVSGFKVFSVYPSDLFICTCEILPVDLHVGPPPALRIPELLSRDEGGAVDQLLSGKEGDYWMQKAYQEGEDASLINWSMSARSLSEWVLVKSVKFGLNKKLCFDFAGIEGQMFEDCLEITAGLILRLRQHDIDGFVWAPEEHGGYCWQSVIFDLPGLVRWLASAQPGRQPLPEDADVELLRFSDVYRSFS